MRDAEYFRGQSLGDAASRPDGFAALPGSKLVWQKGGAGMKTFVSALSPNCKEAARLQSAALDRRLGLLERLGLRCHLLLCKWCGRYGKQIKFLGAAAREQTPAHGLSTEARERIKRRLQSEMERIFERL
jgi:hypothetical protein